MSTIQFGDPGAGNISSNDRLQHIAIQAAAVMLQSWFEKSAPTAEQAKSMIEMGGSPWRSEGCPLQAQREASRAARQFHLLIVHSW
jgi:hypothetical protein